MTEITITNEQLRHSVIEYIKDNQKKPKKEQTKAYKELERIFKEEGIPTEKIPEIICMWMGGNLND